MMHDKSSELCVLIILVAMEMTYLEFRLNCCEQIIVISRSI